MFSVENVTEINKLPECMAFFFSVLFFRTYKSDKDGNCSNQLLMVLMLWRVDVLERTTQQTTDTQTKNPTHKRSNVVFKEPLTSCNKKKKSKIK